MAKSNKGFDYRTALRRVRPAVAEAILQQKKPVKKREARKVRRQVSTKGQP